MLRQLQLSTEQRREVLTLVKEYRGKYRTDEFRVKLLNVLTAEQVEKLEKLRNPNRQGLGKDYKVDRDIVYGRRERTDPRFLSLDIYRRDGADDKLPVIVMIHGGGWRVGDKSNKAVGADKGRFFSDQGFVYVSINYRLTPAVTHPGHIVDVAEAIAWVHDRISKYGGDPEQLFVMGHSAGAHLAALVATDHRRLAKHDKPLSIIDGVILLDGAGYDIPAKLNLGRAAANKMYRNAFTEDEAVQQDASPIHHVSAGKSIPPFLIIPIARRIDSNKMSENLAKAIKEAGGTANVFVAEGKTHASVNGDIGKPNDKPTAEIMKFVEKQMKKP
jgi:acetyl esterase/lipase